MVCVWGGATRHDRRYDNNGGRRLCFLCLRQWSWLGHSFFFHCLLQRKKLKISEHILFTITAKGCYRNWIDITDTVSHHTMYRQPLLQGIVSPKMFVGLRVRNTSVFPGGTYSRKPSAWLGNDEELRASKEWGMESCVPELGAMTLPYEASEQMEEGHKGSQSQHFQHLLLLSTLL